MVEGAIVVFRVNTSPEVAELLPVGGRLSDGTVKGVNDRDLQMYLTKLKLL